jgi:rhodanese-related sulfurtransferase
VTLDELVERARARIDRLTPAEAFAAATDGAIIVDTRSDRDRERDGVISGSLHIPRTVLEWRLAPESRWRSPHVAIGQRVVVMCAHGYSSSLAAATLVELGIDAADVVGGFEAWREAGLPLQPAPSSRADELPGTSPPD